MYCPKCKHTSFDHLATCPKCGYDWQSIRTALNLNWLQSAGHEWLPGSTSEPPEEVEELDHSTAPEPVDFELDVEAAELFAFDEQTSEFNFSPPDESVQSEDIPAVSVAAPIQDSFEVAPDARIEPDGMDDIPLEIPTSQAEVVPAEDADTPTLSQVDKTKTDFSNGAKTIEDELPAWEIELPQDLLPQEYFLEPITEERGPMGTSDKEEHDDVEEVGDIAYDFSEIEVLVPDSQHAAQVLVSNTPSPTDAAEGDDAENGSAPLPPGDRKEER